jgi:hypothetical protein
MDRWRFDLDQIRKNWESLGLGVKHREAEDEEARDPLERWHLDLDQIRKNWERLSLAGRGGLALYYEGLLSSESAEPQAAPNPGPAAPGLITMGPQAVLDPGGQDALALQQDPGSPAVSAPPVPGERDPDRPRSTTPYRFAGFEAPRASLPSRFAGVEVPRDPYPEAQMLLGRVRALVRRQFAAQEPLLAPFLDEAAEIIQLLAAKPAEPVEGEAPPVDKKKLRTDLDRALGDLEDMAALWSGIGR